MLSVHELYDRIRRQLAEIDDYLVEVHDLVSERVKTNKVKCPNCHGIGQVSIDRYTQDGDSWEVRQCVTCKGKGFSTMEKLDVIK